VRELGNSSGTAYRQKPTTTAPTTQNPHNVPLLRNPFCKYGPTDRQPSSAGKSICLLSQTDQISTGWFVLSNPLSHMSPRNFSQNQFPYPASISHSVTPRRFYAIFRHLIVCYLCFSSRVRISAMQQTELPPWLLNSTLNCWFLLAICNIVRHFWWLFRRPTGLRDAHLLAAYNLSINPPVNQLICSEITIMQTAYKNRWDGQDSS